MEVQQQIDSLKAIAKLKASPKIYPFNPNFITDFKGYTLGMTTEEIDRLLNYRSGGKWINSAGQFQQVTGVSDSLLERIKPYFKFPDFIRNNRLNKPRFPASSKPRTFKQKVDLNKATAEQLRMVNGIGKVLSERIIKYRNSFPGGFIADVQLKDIYGLTPEVIGRVQEVFTVKTPRPVERLNLNTATVEQLVTVQHID
ncbi:MAG: helix-hairpin-helix domain-containing protein, partial [Flavobacteriaceae bacterium]|nr:helix-hairpin-helix domain-containing protein [Flavobacteriaceae bacterium]